MRFDRHTHFDCPGKRYQPSAPVLMITVIFMSRSLACGIIRILCSMQHACLQCSGKEDAAGDRGTIPSKTEAYRSQQTLRSACAAGCEHVGQRMFCRAWHILCCTDLRIAGETLNCVIILLSFCVQLNGTFLQPNWQGILLPSCGPHNPRSHPRPGAPALKQPAAPDS